MTEPRGGVFGHVQALTLKCFVVFVRVNWLFRRVQTLRTVRK